MKTIIFTRLKQHTFKIIICLLFINIQVQAQWKYVNVGTQYGTLYSVDCINKDTVFVCGLDGLILKTQDGGTNWEQKRLVADEELRIIKFANDSVGYAAGIWNLYYKHALEIKEIRNFCILLKTTDGGETWQQLIKDSTAGFMDLHVIDADTLYALKLLSRYLYKSIDGGMSWDSIAFSISLMDFDFKDNLGYILDSNSIIYKTIDYGKTWDSVNVSTQPYLGINLLLNGINTYALNVNDKLVVNMDISIIDNNKVQLFNNKMEESENKFTYISNKISLPLYEISDVVFTMCPTDFSRVKYLSNGIGICIGYTICDNPNYPVQKTVYYPTPGMALTRDFGKTWNRFVYGLNGSKNVYFDIDGYGDSTFYAVGTYGTIIKSGNLSVNIPEHVVSSNVSIYPNPVDDKLYIKTDNNRIKIVVLYDVMGKEIMKKQVINNEIELDVKFLHSGLYIIKLYNDNAVINKKIMKF
ncbi:MAG: YCF48-related protein [Bacteroidales bacterium]|nr:YCF48-related protein [Proteiniphilum sp.]